MASEKNHHSASCLTQDIKILKSKRNTAKSNLKDNLLRKTLSTVLTYIMGLVMTSDRVAYILRSTTIVLPKLKNYWHCLKQLHEFGLVEKTFYVYQSDGQYHKFKTLQYLFSLSSSHLSDNRNTETCVSHQIWLLAIWRGTTLTSYYFLNIFNNLLYSSEFSIAFYIIIVEICISHEFSSGEATFFVDIIFICCIF